MCHNVDREGKMKDKGITDLSKGIKELENLQCLNLNFFL